MTMSESALEEATAALRWITSNADVGPEFPNSDLRLRQILSRAEEALRDIDYLRKYDPPDTPEGAL